MAGYYQACPVCGRSRMVSDGKDQPPYPCASCKYSSLVIALAKPIGPWASEGLCAQTDPELFFPSYDAAESNNARIAKRVCAECPVRLECLEHALEADEKHGIWGGLSPLERRKLKRKGGNAA